MPNDVRGTQEKLNTGWRFKVGLAMLSLSILGPLICVPLVASLELSGTVTASVSGIVLVSAELLMVAAIAVMGKEGYETIKGYAFGLLKHYGPPDKVGRPRYMAGLLMFIVPILFGWLSPYLQELVFDHANWSITLALSGDLILLASLFVLGGDFWDKLRSLFIHDATASFTEA